MSPRAEVLVDKHAVRILQAFPENHSNDQAQLRDKVTSLDRVGEVSLNSHGAVNHREGDLAEVQAKTIPGLLCAVLAMSRSNQPIGTRVHHHGSVQM